MENIIINVKVVNVGGSMGLVIPKKYGEFVKKGDFLEVTIRKMV